MVLGKGVLKVCSKFIEEDPFRNVNSMKLLCNFIEIALRHGCSPVNLLHIFRTPFSKNTSEQLLLKIGQTDFTHWMSFLSSNLMEEIGPNPEARNANIKNYTIVQIGRNKIYRGFVSRS